MRDVDPTADYMTEAEAARRLGITLARMRWWSEDGRLKPERAEDGSLLFRRSDIEALRIAIKKAKPRCRS
jgi:predicted site-specific integrase-resolvase